MFGTVELEGFSECETLIELTEKDWRIIPNKSKRVGKKKNYRWMDLLQRATLTRTDLEQIEKELVRWDVEEKDLIIRSSIRVPFGKKEKQNYRKECKMKMDPFLRHKKLMEAKKKNELSIFLFYRFFLGGRGDAES